MDEITVVYFDYETQKTVVDQKVPDGILIKGIISVNEGDRCYRYELCYYNDSQKVAFALRVD
jgi:hypothetical protein